MIQVAGEKIVRQYISELSQDPNSDIRELILDVLIQLAKYYDLVATPWFVSNIEMNVPTDVMTLDEKN